MPDPIISGLESKMRSITVEMQGERIWTRPTNFPWKRKVVKFRKICRFLRSLLVQWPFKILNTASLDMSW
jgi:hypothetical protein